MMVKLNQLLTNQRGKKLMKQHTKLPGVGQLAVCCALSLLVHGGVADEEAEQERGRA